MIADVESGRTESGKKSQRSSEAEDANFVNNMIDETQKLEKRRVELETNLAYEKRDLDAALKTVEENKRILDKQNRSIKEERKAVTAAIKTEDRKRLEENKRILDAKKKDVQRMLSDILKAAKSKSIYAGTRNEIKEILTGYQLKPKKNLTKDMLSDKQAARRVADRAERNEKRADAILRIMTEGIPETDPTRDDVMELLESQRTLDQMTIESPLVWWRVMIPVNQRRRFKDVIPKKPSKQFNRIEPIPRGDQASGSGFVQQLTFGA
jgi:hypothetical protein